MHRSPMTPIFGCRNSHAVSAPRQTTGCEAVRSPIQIASVKHGPCAVVYGVVIGREQMKGEPERLRLQITPTRAEWVRARECEVL